MSPADSAGGSGGSGKNGESVPSRQHANIETPPAHRTANSGITTSTVHSGSGSAPANAIRTERSQAAQAPAVDLIQVAWLARLDPLTPYAVCARDRSAIALGQNTLLRQPERLERLRWITVGEILIILGEAESLPWSDGAIYLGHDVDVPMYMPTFLRPSVPSLLLQRALLKAVAKLTAPFAVLPDHSQVIPLAEARLIDRNELKLWLEIIRQMHQGKAV